MVRKHSPSLSWVGQSLQGVGWAFKVLGVPGPEGIPNPVQSTPSPTLLRLIFFLVQPVSTLLLLISRTPLPDSSQLAHQPHEGLPRTQAPLHPHIAVPDAANREQ